MAFDSVKKLLEWKVGKNKNITSIEDVNKEILQKLEWDECDVLYSFLGIYAIGFWVYNKEKFPDCFRVELNKIRIFDENIEAGIRNVNAINFLMEVQKEESEYDVKELNNALKEFCSVYFEVGNLIPMWPGGNTLKGNQNNGYMDVPEIFFYKYKKWFQILKKEYSNAFLDVIDVGAERYNSLKSFLESVDTVEKYNEYIKKVVSTIKKRTKKIKEYIKQNCTK